MSNSSFPLPPQGPVTEAAHWQNAAQLALTTIDFTPDSPEKKTTRELENIRKFTPEEDVGFGTKFYNAFAEETVIGQAVSDLGNFISGPSFEDTGYSPTDEDRDTFGSDLRPETVDRIANASGSFEEFLFELDQARITEKRRTELFGGGAWGFTQGLGLTMVAAGGESALAALTASALTGGAGAPAAATSTVAQIANVARKATRARAIMKAAGLAAAIDVPLEGFRYHLDKTLTTTDLLINIGASAVLSGGIGAVFPEKFVGQMLRTADEAKIRQAMEGAEGPAKERLAKLLKARVKVRKLLDPDDPAEEVSMLDNNSVRAEAKKYGIRVRDSYYESEIVINPVTGKEERVLVRKMVDDPYNIRESLEDTEPVSYTVGRKKPPKKRRPEDEPIPEDLQVPGLRERRVQDRVKEKVDEELGDFVEDAEILDDLDTVDTAATRDRVVKKLASAEDEVKKANAEARKSLSEAESDVRLREDRIPELQKERQRINDEIQADEIQLGQLEKHIPQARKGLASKDPSTPQQQVDHIRGRQRILRKSIAERKVRLKVIQDELAQTEYELKMFRSELKTYKKDLYLGERLDEKLTLKKEKEMLDPVDITTELNVLRGFEDDPFKIVKVLNRMREDPKRNPFALGPGKDSLTPGQVLLKEYFDAAKKKVVDIEGAKIIRRRGSAKAKAAFAAKKAELEKEYTAKLVKAQTKSDKLKLKRDFDKRLNEGQSAVGFAPASAASIDAVGEAKKIRYKRIRRQPYRDLDEVREELIARKRAEQQEISEAAEKAVEKQVATKWKRLGKIGNGASARRRYAEVLGVTGAVLKKGGKPLYLAVVAAAKVAAKRGFAITGGIGKPKGISFSSTITVGKTKYGLAGNIEQMLWKFANAKGKNAAKVRDTISSFLKEKGLEDPEKLANEFVGRVKKDIKERAERIAKKAEKRKDFQGPVRPEKPYVADLAEMELDSALRNRDGIPFKPAKGEPLFGEPREVNFRVDREAFEVGDLESSSVKKAVDENTIEGTNYKKDELPSDSDLSDLESKPASEVEEGVVSNDTGEPLATGPVEDADAATKFVEIGDEHVTPEQGGVSSHSDGIRDRLQHSANEGNFGISSIPIIGKHLYKIFTPVVQRFLNSKSPIVRRFASVFHDNPVGKGQASIISIARLNFERQVGWLQQQLAIAGEAARRQGLRILDKDVIRAVRGGGTPDGPLGAAVRAIREYNKRMLKYAKDNGIDVKDIPDADDYFVRSWSPIAYRNLVEKVGGFEGGGAEKVALFLAEAIKKKTPSLTDRQSRVLADRIADYLRNPESKRELNKSITTLDSLKKKLVEELEDIQDDALAEAGGITGLAEDLIGIIAHNHTGQPNLSLGRRRMALDELHKGEIDGVAVHIDELMDMDINMITRRYAQQVIGGVSASKGIKAVFGDKIKTISDVKKHLREASENAGDAKYETKMYENMVDMTYKTLTGQQIYGKNWMKLAVANNMFAQATIGMTLGFAQIPEIANVVCRSGFRAAFEQFNLRDMISTFGMGFKRNRMRSEIDEFSSCLEGWSGIGGDHSRGDHFMRRMDDIGFDDADFTTSRIGKFFDAGRLTAVLNPMGVMPMDTFMRRWAARASFQHFVNTAFNVGADGSVKLSRGWWKNSATRFAQIGMSEADINRLSKILKNTDLVKYERGIWGKYKVKSFDFSKVDDQAIVDKFVMAIRRNTDSMIQRQTFSEMPAWMNTNFGKVISQFRVFTMVAKSKQLAAGLARGDGVEAVNVVSSAGLALMGYTMQTYYRSLGQSDPEAYYKSKTDDWEMLIKNAVSRSGYATVLPALIDLGANRVTGEGVFDPSARTTGQQLHPVYGATLWSNSDKVHRALDNTADAMFRGREFTQHDMRNLMGLLWITKLPVLDQLINRNFTNTYPESNR